MNGSGTSCFTVAAIILAAGEARRMGTLKQLLPFQSGTLLGHSIEVARNAGFDPILVVVGAQADSVQASIASKPVEIVQNPHWRLGMGSSIRAGAARFQELGADSAAIAILLGDQPLVTPDHLREMRRRLSTSEGWVLAAQYGGTLGVPALFRRSLLSTLGNIPPDAGAKKLLHNPEFKVEAFELPEAAVDVDTPEDWARLEASPFAV